MGTAAIYVDGGYLDKVLYHDFGNRRINYEALSREMASPDELLRAYYYHCLPYQSNPPTEEERQRYSSMHRFLKKVSYLPRFEVRLGKLAFRGRDRAGNPIFVQKRVDTMIGVDMALLAGKGRVTKMAIFTGDSDYIPAIEAVKREGILVILWHGTFSENTSPSRELCELCDERIQLTPEIVERIAR